MEDIVFDTNDFLILEFNDLAPNLRPLEITFNSPSIIMENPTIPGSGGSVIINSEIISITFN